MFKKQILITNHLEKVEKGNEAVISALRGIRYREKRQEKDPDYPKLVPEILPAQSLPQITGRYS